MSYEDILYEIKEGIATVTINRPKVYNAFRPKTIEELTDAFTTAGDDPEVGVIVLTGAGEKAFCTGGDMGEWHVGEGYTGASWTGIGLSMERLHRMIRSVPKPVIASVNGYAIGGGNVLQVLCDLAIASETAVFGQVGPKVGSFDAGFGTAYLARLVGERKAREIWMLCRRYSAKEALQMGLINHVVPQDQLAQETEKWAKEVLALSPTALKAIKYSFNADTEHIAGLTNLAMASVGLYYRTPESGEGHNAFKEKRPTDFMRYRKPGF
ncbi:MAG: enoyl-CoA hydratase-related protein [Nitrospirota bacterium]|nr:enoyl-CoA hydratase-related protein [Nitrospirota bacterium]